MEQGHFSCHDLKEHAALDFQPKENHVEHDGDDMEHQDKDTKHELNKVSQHMSRYKFSARC